MFRNKRALILQTSARIVPKQNLICAFQKVVFDFCEQARIGGVERQSGKWLYAASASHMTWKGLTLQIG